MTTSKMLFTASNFCKIIFAPRILFQSVRSSKYTYSENVFKLQRLLRSSGCVIAGCCFSRQSDEETILVKKYEENIHEIDEKESVQFEPNFKQVASNSKEMKISIDLISNIQNTDNCEDSILAFDVKVKRKKTELKEIVCDKSFQKELPISKRDSSTHVSIEPHKTHPEKSQWETQRSKKHQPNYFVAVKISDSQIYETLSELQTHILEKDERLKKCMIGIETLHITLMVMHIGDDETHTRAMKALENIHQEHDEDMSKNPIKLEFQGLGHFNNRVLYAKLSEDDSYLRLCLLAESVKQHFEAVSIPSTDTRQGFTPHLTIAKIDYKKKHNRFIKKINPLFYKDYNNQYFGSQKVMGIQLLSMLDPKNEAGYYSGNEIYFSAFNPTAKHNLLSKKLGTEENKKNVKEMINALMKDKLN